MNIKDPKTTLRLEPALRELCRDAATNLSRLATRHAVDETDLKEWLVIFNKGSKLLSAKTVDQVKAQLGSVIVQRDPGVLRPIGTIAPALRNFPGPGADLGKWLDGQKAVVRGRANTFLVDVTPAMARSWLTLNVANRKPSKAKIRRFAAAMKAGNWAQNGETVKFSVSGRLIDGQSRLMALEQAGGGGGRA